MTRALAVACATLAIRRYDGLAALEAHFAALAAQAAAEGADLLLLPEFSCLGLLWSAPEAGRTDARAVGALYDRVLTPLYGDYCAVLAGIAARSGIAVAGATFWHREGERRLNSGFLIRPDGALHRQDKLHPTRPERAIGTTGGSGLAVVDLCGSTVALAICYDLQFPEAMRALADAGAEVILCPSLTTERGYWRVRHAAHARAIENQCHVCVAPLTGDLGIPFDHPVRATGRAYATQPIDEHFDAPDGTCAEAARDREGLLVVRLDLDRLARARSRAEVRPWAERHPGGYRAERRSLAEASPVTAGRTGGRDG